MQEAIETLLGADICYVFPYHNFHTIKLIKLSSQC